MSNSLSRHGGPSRTPQTQPMPGRTDMVKNDAGGYSFASDTWTRLRDFLILGTEGGTYYATEQAHTYRNVRWVADALAEDGPRAVGLAVEISTARPARAPKNYPALYVVAAALASDDLATRRAAANTAPLVARTTDHQAHLFGYLKAIRGGRGGGGPVVKRAFANMLTHDDPESVAFRYFKGRARKTGDGEPFGPADLLRLAKPHPASPAQDALFGLISGKIDAMQASGQFACAKAFYEAQRADTPAKAVRAINAYHVPWEFLPTQVLKAPDVWEALVPHLGLTALIRNLARMTQLGVLGPFKQSNKRIYDRITDQGALHRARIHPFDLFLALRVYESGRAQPNPKAPVRTWTPVPEVVDALNLAYERSFAVAEKVPGNLLVAVDKSGSMGWNQIQHGGSNIGTPYAVSLAVAQILMRTWGGQVHALNFDSRVVPSPIRADMSLSEVMRKSGNNGGATDAAQPILWALQYRHHVDGFVMLTDQESWAGSWHATEALRDYRRTVNPSARVIWAATTAAGHTLGDSKDPGVIGYAGFDASLPQLVAEFVSPAVSDRIG